MVIRGEKNLFTSSPLGYELGTCVDFENTIGYSTIGFYLEVPTGATVSFQGSFNGINFEEMNVRSTTKNIYLQQTSENGNFIASITTLKKIRLEVIKAGSAPGHIDVVLDQSPTILEGIEYGWPPHRFGYKQEHRDLAASTIQNGTPIWTPALGKKFVVTDLFILAYGNIDAIVSIYDDVDIIGHRLFNGKIEVVTNKQFEWNHAYKTPFTAENINTSLKLSTSAAISINISVHGYEI